MAESTPKKKKKKERFFARVRRRLREAYSLGNTLVKNPRAFPAQAGGVLKRMFRTMWEARGGGFYACGFVLTFVWLEITTLIGEVSQSTGVIDFFTEQFVEFLLRFSIQSLGNSIQAFLWPLLIIDYLGPISIALLLAVYLLFARFLKPSLTAWLFDDAVPASAAKIPESAREVSSSVNQDTKPRG